MLSIQKVRQADREIDRHSYLTLGFEGDSQPLQSSSRSRNNLIDGQERDRQVRDRKETDVFETARGERQVRDRQGRQTGERQERDRRV